MNKPSGTVTFLFTDIEGSTKLARTHQEVWETLRARHHDILRVAIEANHGYVFQIIGDAFCAAFHTAGDALRAAARSQIDLHAENWGDAPVKVRMGIHTGKAEIQENGEYHGYLAMSRIQRLMSAGHGGQVLISAASQELLLEDLPEGISLRDLGERRLKDLIRPEHIYQLVIPDLPVEFPPLKTLDFYRHNLPVQLTSFIGREKEMEEIKQAIRGHRLLTLTGVGGTGKTRLSLQVAADLIEQFPDGVWFIELAPITDPNLVSQTILSALEVPEQPGMTIQQQLLDYLHRRKLLLVLDNCEHLIEASAKLVEVMLNHALELKIMTTSREALGVAGELIWHVPSLSLPDIKQLPTIEQLSQYEAVQLFIDRSILVQPHFLLTKNNAPAIAQICFRLDGIPLAIELAAARAKFLSVGQIASRLDDCFRLLTGGSRTSLPRHQTLRATIDWSYNLLSRDEQLLLCRLSVFVGGWTLQAAEAVAGDGDVMELLARLVDKSLVAVVHEHDNDARYYFLETIRQYGQEKLDQNGEANQIRARHLEYFLKLAQKVEFERHGEKMAEWLQKLEDEQDNVRAALEWSLQGNVTAGQQLADALSSCEWWGYSGHVSEGYEWLGKMLAVSTGDETLLRANLLSEAGWLAASLDYTEQSIALSKESLALYRQFGDKRGMAHALAVLGSRAYVRSDYDQSATLLQESYALYREAGDKPGVAWVLIGLGYTANAQGNFEQAEKFYEESLTISKELGGQNDIGGTLYFMGNLAVSQGNDTRAMQLYEEALRIQKLVKAKNLIAWILNEMGMISIRSGDYKRAEQFLEEGLEAGRGTGKPADMAYSLHGLGIAARLQRDFAKARLLYTESLQLVQPLHLEHDVNLAEYLIGVSHVMAAEGLFEKFAHVLGMAEKVVPDIQKQLTKFLTTETEEFIEMAHTALGSEAYTAAWEEGRNMSLDEAITYALNGLQ